MSYDLAIWKGALPPKRAAAAYANLASLPPTPAIAACYRAIIARFPELDDDNEDVSPWSTALDVGDRYLVAPMVYSRAADVPGEVAAIAKAHGLVVYDPQTRGFVALARKKPAPAHDPGAVLAAGLARPLARHGFALAPYQLFAGMPVFARRDGIATQELTFRPMTARHVDAWLRIQLDPISAILDPITAGWKRGLSSGWHGGAMANDLYALQLGVVGPVRSLIGDHDISPDGIARTLCQVPLQLKRYGLPIFDKLRTLAQLDAFLHARPYVPQERAHFGDCELALTGAVVTKLVGRRGRAKWLVAYRRLVSYRMIVPPHQKAARGAFAKLV